MPGLVGLFVHPNDLKTRSACEDWRNARLKELYAYYPPVSPKFLEILKEINRAYYRCVDRVMDSSLKEFLSGNCCDKWPTQQEREACAAELNNVMKALERARNKIYGAGGPAMFKPGKVCTTCAHDVMEEIGRGYYFTYETRAHSLGLPFGVPTQDHCWGELVCRDTQNYAYGGVVVTIDFWKGGHDYWKEGNDAPFGWSHGEGWRCPTSF